MGKMGEEGRKGEILIGRGGGKGTEYQRKGEQ